MQNTLKLFHYLSFATYPLLLLGLFFVYRPFFMPESYDDIKDVTMGMVIMGFAVGLSSLKDHTKLNKFSRGYLSKPKFMRGFILILGLILITGSIFSIYVIYTSEKPPLREASIGIMSLCLGGFGLIKTMIQLVKDFEAGLIK